jgi:hypothetical protein
MRKKTKKFIRAKKELYSQLQKLCKETEARRAKEDTLTCASKALCCSEKELQIMKCIFDAPLEKKRCMKITMGC